MSRDRLHQFIVPSALSFGAMFAIGAFGRALMAAVIPLEALDLLGSARNVSLLYFGMALVNLVASFAIPALISAFRRRRIYVLAILLGARERAEMTMVYVTFIQMTELIPMAVFAILLSLFDLSAIFIAMSLLLLWSAWIARWVPKTM